jgi:hypothetical protein
MTKFKSEVSYTERGLKIHFYGSIIEDARFDTLMGLSQPEMIIDLQGTTGMNSSGIRNWIKWIHSIDSTKCQLIFQNCPKYFVDQINLVSGLIPENAIIESFFVPFYGKDTNTETFVLYRRGKEFNGPTVMHPEVIHDPKTGEEMLVDVSGHFFDFLERQKPRL